MGAASISSLDCLFAVSLSLAPQRGLGRIVPEKKDIRDNRPCGAGLRSRANVFNVRHIAGLTQTGTWRLPLLVAGHF